MRALLLFILVVVVGIANIWTTGPVLWRDLQIRNKAFVPAPDLIVQRAKCTTHWFVYTSCDIDYTTSAAPGPQPAVQNLSYAFLGWLPEKQFRLMRLPDRRDVVVADVGINHLIRRIAGLFVFTALMGLAAFVFWRLIGAREREADAPASRLA